MRRSPTRKALNDIPLKTEGEKSVFVSDVGKAVDGSALQYNIVRVNGQRSVYVPILKQGGNTNTIAVVNGISSHQDSAGYSFATEDARGVRPIVVRQAGDFDRSERRRHRPLPDGVMILIFLGSPRATAAVFLSIPLSVMATFFFLHAATRPSTAWF